MTASASSKMGSATSKADASASTDSDLQTVRELCRSFSIKCRDPQCSASLDIGNSGAHVTQWLSKSKVIPPKSQISELSCPRCRIATCAGCGSIPAIGPLNLFTPLGVINNCCDQGRLFGIWFLLARFDQDEIRRTAAKPETPIKKEKRKMPKHKGIPKGAMTAGVGYGGEDFMYGGFEFEGDLDYLSYGYPPLYHNVEPAKDNEEQDAADALMTEILRLLAPFLTSARSPSGEEERSLISLSFLLDRFAALLRNDSIEDMTNRRELYLEMYAFMLSMAEDPKLLQLLIKDRPKKINSPGLKELGFPTTNNLPVIYSATETTTSLFKCGKNTYQQAHYYLKLNNPDRGGERLDKKTSQSVEICQRFTEIHELLQAKVESPSTAHILDSEETWVKFSEDNRVMFTDEVLHSHRDHARFNGPQTGIKGRINTINKEIATLMTSLPAGIFLKVAESRSDVMKFLIVGVEGTPYEGGLFIFDMFLPMNYPQSPPSVKFVLNGNDDDFGSFNPNLHVGGTVCLSLLNTWEGTPDQQWQPYKSTILSVLISIQAMILGAPLPWLNEPGREYFQEHPEATAHNKYLQSKTVRHAMIAWVANKFTDPKSKEYIWKDIVQTYFKHHGQSVVEVVKEWAKTNPELLKYVAGRPPKRARLKPKKGKQAAAHAEADAAAAAAAAEAEKGINLVKNLSLLLGLEFKEAPPEPEPSSSATPSRKREHSPSGTLLDKLQQGVKKFKQLKSEDENMEAKWIYTGPHNQKEVRKACKEFKIGAAATIVGTISKLENHVNGKGKVSEELVQKWGKMTMEESKSGSSGDMSNSTSVDSDFVGGMGDGFEEDTYPEMGYQEFFSENGWPTPPHPGFYEPPMPMEPKAKLKLMEALEEVHAIKDPKDREAAYAKLIGTSLPWNHFQT